MMLKIIGVVIVLVILIIIFVKPCGNVEEHKQQPLIFRNTPVRDASLVVINQSLFVQDPVKISEIRVWAKVGDQLVNITDKAEIIAVGENVDALTTPDVNDQYNSGRISNKCSGKPMIALSFVEYLKTNSARIVSVEFINTENLQDAPILIGDERKRPEYWAMYRAPHTPNFTITV